MSVEIIGRRSFPKVEGALLHHGSRPENFRRTFELDPSIDADKISARVDQGLVTLTLPKAERVNRARSLFRNLQFSGKKRPRTARSGPFDLFRFFSAWRIADVEVITVT